ncbi:MAG TPA: hypothetical protein VKP65_22995 [Rhodothermales bacterium]|nr:hypothetical protein [Rhodothermales bacterium]
MRRFRFSWGWLLGLCLLLVAPQSACQQAPAPATPAPGVADSSFAHLVARLSEPGGYFDTDNLISNETSYLHVLGTLQRLNIEGGAYLGVGPDQNFAYIAQIRPTIAFIVDIRRDNLLQQVFFKSQFALAPTRIEYLCLFFGKPIPEDVASWTERPLQDMVAYLDATPTPPDHAREVLTRVREQATQAGLPLSEEDLNTIESIHHRFITQGLDVRFHSHNRTPNAYYPTYRDLLLETDLSGQLGSYLAHEGDYLFIRQMQAKNRIVPVVGDLAGKHALKAIGDYLKARGERVSVFYTSNVEFYLFRQLRFAQYVENLQALPWDDQSIIIRSFFNRYRGNHPQTMPGYASTQLLQTIESLIQAQDAGGYAGYGDLITRDVIDVRQ